MDYVTKSSFNDLHLEISQIFKHIPKSYFSSQRWSQEKHFGSIQHELIDTIYLNPLADVDNKQNDTEPGEGNIASTGVTTPDTQYYLVIIRLSSRFYHIPILIHRPQGRMGLSGNELLIIQGPSYQAVLREATQDPKYHGFILKTLMDSKQHKFGNRSLVFLPNEHAVDQDALNNEISSCEIIDEDQSNSIAILNNKMAAKVLRCLDYAAFREYDIVTYLSSKNFPHVPKLYGTLLYRNPDITDDYSEKIATRDHDIYPLMIYYEFIPKTTNLWYFSLSHLADLLTYLSQRFFKSGWEKAVQNRSRDYLNIIDKVAVILVEFHKMVSSSESNPNFSPKATTPENLDIWFDGAMALLERVNVNPTLDLLPIIEFEGKIEHHFKSLKQLGEKVGPRIRCHGDFHLGQILKQDNKLYILDFEGEPLRKHGERTARQPAMKDIACICRSFSYAANAAFSNYLIGNPGNEQKAKQIYEWLTYWAKISADRFLNTYKQEAKSHNLDIIPTSDYEFNLTLNCLMLEKAIYEVNYEINSRPDWVRIPVRGVLHCLSHLDILEKSRLKKAETEKTDEK